MFKIEQQNIYYTRGDTAKFYPILEDYVAQEGDTVSFTVKKTINDVEPGIKITIPAGDEVTLTHECALLLTPGSYLYDLKLETVDGEISTFVNCGRFYLLGELDNGSIN